MREKAQGSCGVEGLNISSGKITIGRWEEAGKREGGGGRFWGVGAGSGAGGGDN